MKYDEIRKLVQQAIAEEVEPAQPPTVTIELDEGAQMPTRATDGSAGYDLYAHTSVRIRGKTNMAAIPTGVRLAVPPGWEAQVRSRSGLAMKQGAFVLNSPGTVDSDYRGELMVLLMNLGRWHLDVKRGDRIAQLVFNRIELPTLAVGVLDKTTRGEGGLGSTGQ